MASYSAAQTIVLNSNALTQRWDKLSIQGLHSLMHLAVLKSYNIIYYTYCRPIIQ